MTQWKPDFRPVTPQVSPAAGLPSYLARVKILIRSRQPGYDPGHIIEADAETPCTLVPAGCDLLALVEVHGRPFIDGSEPWDAPVVRLRDCKVGAIVFTNRAVWVKTPIHWTRDEITSAPFE